MIDKPQLPGSGSPTTPALIEWLERRASECRDDAADFDNDAETPWLVREAANFRAAADALRSLPDIQRDLNYYRTVAQAFENDAPKAVAKLLQQLRAAEAEVARLTDRLTDEKATVVRLLKDHERLSQSATARDTKTHDTP